MAIYIEKSDQAFNAQFKNFSVKIGKYQLGLTTDEVTAIHMDAAAFDLILNFQTSIQTYAQTVTTYKNLYRKGGGSVGNLPVAPVASPLPNSPLPNLEARLRAILQRIVNHPNYTKAIGDDLGIESSPETFSATEGKPSFFIEPSSGGYPNLRWTKGKFQGVEIWKDAGKGFVKLDRDMRPDYIDKSPLPTLGDSALWKYKMIYLVNDEHVGNWSDVVSVTVHGEV